jgi:hypothetical protein
LRLICFAVISLLRRIRRSDWFQIGFRFIKGVFQLDCFVFGNQGSDWFQTDLLVSDQLVGGGSACCLDQIESQFTGQQKCLDQIRSRSKTEVCFCFGFRIAPDYCQDAELGSSDRVVQGRSRVRKKNRSSRKPAHRSEGSTPAPRRRARLPPSESSFAWKELAVAWTGAGISLAGRPKCLLVSVVLARR